MEAQTPDLSGRKAIILGANDPVAAAIARVLARAGADVAVTSTSGDPEEAFALRPLRRAIEAEGRQAIADIADLGNGSSVQIAVRQIAKQLGRIDIAVVVSSATLDKPSERITDAEWSHSIGFNLGAYFYAARAVAREFATNDAPVDGVKGRFLAILPPLEAAAASPVRIAARAAVEALMQALGREWAEDGIAVALLAPEPDADETQVVQDAVTLISSARPTNA
jgi:3-oxoacyl-[acyl-carrier protein] reductase